MKKTIKLFLIILVAIMLIPFTVVNAASIEEVLDQFNTSDTLKSINGTAKYEDDTIEIEYSITNTNVRNISFQCQDGVIEYIPEEITDYDEAEDVISHIMYATNLISSALQLNGYTDEQISSFFQSADSKLDYEINGIEIKEIGEAKSFTGGQYDTTLTVTPLSIKINVAKANLNTSSNDQIDLKQTTIEDVVANLKSNDNFTSDKYEDGKIAYKNEINYEDDLMEIEQTSYSYDYHNISFPCLDGVLTYKAEEITSYDEANDVAEHGMWALLIMQYALQANGYTHEEIIDYLQSEDNKLDYETNGIEIKEIGEAKSFTGDLYGDTTTVTPVSIKINFAKANIGTIVKDEKVQEESTIEKTNTDNKEEQKEDNTNIKQEQSNNKTENNKVVQETSNPKTGDNIIMYIAIFAMSVIAIIILVHVIRKKQDQQ